MDSFDHLSEAVDYLKREAPQPPEVAVVLGSGLGPFAGELADPLTIPYESIPHWPRSAVIGHEGKLVIGTLALRRVAALSGRVHFYEGHPLAAVVFGVRVMGLLGVRALILTNAAGGINQSFPKGVLMVIDDHINLLGSNPLIGENDDRLGCRFPDMSEVYSKRLRTLADHVAREQNLSLAHGVYVALHGPSYETPAEIRFLRGIGADAVGMSTVPEAIAARHMGLEVLGISCISNMAAGILPEPLHHAEVMETTARVRGQFVALLKGVIERI
ncbi:MAG: purine-nucleoside phosphorylase [Acidobacteria bacterium]|nr:purine-nucleoside phosphorylase [Acidobacteriota bacterium]